MTTPATALDQALKAAGIPISGVSVYRNRATGDWNKSLWAVRFLPEATAEQRAEAQAILDAFDPVAEAAKPAPPSLEQRIAVLERDLAALKAR